MYTTHLLYVKDFFYLLPNVNVHLKRKMYLQLYIAEPYIEHETRTSNMQHWGLNDYSFKNEVDVTCTLSHGKVGYKTLRLLCFSM